MSTLKDLAFASIDKLRDALQEISKDIWEHPELNFQEKHAHAALTSFLEKEGFHVQKSFPLETAFVARFGKGGGLKFGFICEYDALPEIGHACGHNLIAEAGLAAAIGMKNALSQQGGCGEVVVFGTPAEEGGGGKKHMIEAGVFEGIDICMMVHPFTANEYSPLALAVQPQVYKFHGKASHASAAPWEGINALDAAVCFYNSVSMLRQQMKPSSRVHGIVTNGGAKPNIIPEETELLYYIRDETQEELDVLVKKIDACASAAATATGCTVDSHTDPSGCYSNLLTNATLAKLFCANSKELGADFPQRVGLSGSTDMGNVSKVVPSIHPHYAIPTKGANHTRAFNEAAGDALSQEPTLVVAKAMAASAIDVLENPELMKQIRDDFNNKVTKF